MFKKNKGKSSDWQPVVLHALHNEHISSKGREEKKANPIQIGKNINKSPMILVLGIFVFSLIIGFVLPVRLISPEEFSLSGELIKDITIMYASVVATMLGLCVTAFIFLNDTLKNRADADKSLRSTVNEVFKNYSNKLKWVAVGSAAAIITVVILNVFGKLGFEHMDLSSWEFKTFIVSTVMSVGYVVLIIVFSCRITYSDRLICRQSEKDHKNLEKVLAEIEEKIYANVPENVVDKLKYQDIHDNYNMSMVYVLTFPYRYGITKAPSKTNYSRYTEFLRDMGYIETVIDKICQNNINDSIVASDSVLDSMRIGFKWLYAERKGDKNHIDVRDANRYLDFIKYCLIVAERFMAHGYDNDLMEKAFEEKRKEFAALPVPCLDSNPQPADKRNASENGSTQCDSKGRRIINFKRNLSTLIDNFFYVYEVLYMYKNALIHIENTDAEKDRSRLDRMVSDSAERLAKLLKALLIERFTSFVKINDVNIGNSMVRKGWFNHTVFNDSSFTCSDFEFARLEDTVMRNCDLSTCTLRNADASAADMIGSNLNYSNLIGIDLSDAVLTRTQMSDVAFRDPEMDRAFVQRPIIVEDLPAELKNAETREFLSAIPYTKDSSGRRCICVADMLLEYGSNPENAKRLNENKRLSPDRKRRLSEKVVEWREQTRLYQTNYSDRANDYDAVKDAVSVLRNGINSGRYDNNPGKLMEQVYNALKGFEQKRKTSVIGRKLYNALYDISRIEDETTYQLRKAIFGKTYFRAANLKGATLDEVSLTSADFSHILMSFASYRNADLGESKMFSTTAKGTDFSGCNLRNCDIYRTDFSDAVFRNANLFHVIIACSNLLNANFTEAIMLNSSIINTDPIKNPADGTSYLFQNLHDERHQKDAQLSNAGCRWVLETKYGMDLYSNTKKQSAPIAVRSDWTDVIATESVFIGVDLDTSIFDRANLRRTVFADCAMRWGSFVSADFSDAMLACCSMHQTNLEGCDFAHALLHDVDMSSCCLQNSNMIGMICRNVDFSDCDMRNVNISNCVFINCRFDNTLLDNANVIRARTDASCTCVGASTTQIKGINKSNFFRA